MEVFSFLFSFNLLYKLYNHRHLQIEFLSTANSRPIGKSLLPAGATVADAKLEVHKLKKSLYPDRQSIRLEAKGKTLKDSDTLQSLNIRGGSKLFVKDLGPQIGWKTVFLAEYAGPLAVYLWIYQRPWLFYGDVVAPISLTTQYVFCLYFKLVFFFRYESN